MLDERLRKLFDMNQAEHLKMQIEIDLLRELLAEMVCREEGLSDSFESILAGMKREGAERVQKVMDELEGVNPGLAARLDEERDPILPEDDKD